MRQHNIFIGDKIERAVQVIGEEAEEYDSWDLQSKFADGELDVDVELRGNYLLVQVEE